MGKCCGASPEDIQNSDPCSPPQVKCIKAQTGDYGGNENVQPVAYFDEMVQHCYEYAVKQKDSGAQIVGIMCEYTPREIILAAGGIPVCLCGGSAEMIPAAEEHLPANLCPLIKSTYGYSIKKENPFLEMAALLVAETTCDGKKKMYELLSKRHPMYVLELPQKSDDPDAFIHWKAELHKLAEKLEKSFNTKITKEKLAAAIKVMNRERALRRQLAGLMKKERPPFSGKDLLQMKSLISGIPEDLEQYQHSFDVYDTHEVSQKKTLGHPCIAHGGSGSAWCRTGY